MSTGRDAKDRPLDQAPISVLLRVASFLRDPQCFRSEVQIKADKARAVEIIRDLAERCGAPSDGDELRIALSEAQDAANRLGRYRLAETLKTILAEVEEDFPRPPLEDLIRALEEGSVDA